MRRKNISISSESDLKDFLTNVLEQLQEVRDLRNIKPDSALYAFIISARSSVDLALNHVDEFVL